MAGKLRKIEPGRLAYFCDGCGLAVIGDSGYLTVVNRNGGRRWAVLHDGCQIGQADGTPGRRITVRLSRIADYPLLLTTMASLAAEVVGFETTNWWTFLLRVVHDTEWHKADGTKTHKQLTTENHRLYSKVGYTKRLGVEGIK